MLVPHELSVVTPEQFDRAMEEYGRFGPTVLISIEQRWPAVIPDVENFRLVRHQVKRGVIRDEDIVLSPIVQDGGLYCYGRTMGFSFA
jgi:hypothetical protein